MFSFLEYPFSRGSVQIRSPDPYDPPIFDAGFMNDSRDIAPLVWSYKISREIARRMDGFRGELEYEGFRLSVPRKEPLTLILCFVFLIFSTLCHSSPPTISSRCTLTSIPRLQLAVLT